MPSRDTVRRWQSENGPFRSQYATARDQQADALAEEAIHIARNAEAGTVTVCRLQIDTIKWLTAKIAPQTLRREGRARRGRPRRRRSATRSKRGGSGCGGCGRGEGR